MSAAAHAYRKNVKSSDLFSKDWCELLFQGRNKDYGAYKLRRDTGRRYRRALGVVLASLLLFVGVPAGVHLYMRYQLLMGLKDAKADIERLRDLDKREGFELKRISAGRGAPLRSTVKDAAERAPEITDEATGAVVVGEAGPETYVPDETAELQDRDTTHNRDREDLPIEGPQLTAVEVVEEMPQFPGGLKALMAWLDENVPYPRACIEQKVKGDMEVSFIVDEGGNVLEPQLTRRLHPDLDAAVMDALRRMPRWRPGRRGSRVTAVRVSIPMHFEPN